MGHTQAKRILARIADLHHHPALDKVQNLLLVGEPSSGKTALLRHYAKAYQPAASGQERCALSWPILSVQLTNGPDEAVLYETILTVLQSAFAPRANVASKRHQATQLLHGSGVKLVFLDELHNLLLGSALQQRKFLAGLKYLTNELGIPLVCAGVESARNALCLDKQLSSRFEVARLPQWSMDVEFRRILASFERLLPLEKPSHLADSALAFKLLELSHGSIGRLVRILRLAAIEAIRSGAECISLELLQAMPLFPLADEGLLDGQVRY